MEKALTPSPFEIKMVAPCGINCAVCRAHLRERNRCAGCRQIGNHSPISCQKCFIRACDQREDPYCGSCAVFPCDRIKHLDKRYRIRYGMSEIENLTLIREAGIEAFLEVEGEKWIVDGCVRCVHDRQLYPLRGGQQGK